MTTPSSSEIVLLDTHPQRTQLYLSIYEPTVAMSCQVSGSYSASNQSISYDNVTAGNYLNIGSYVGYLQTALIGTAPGLEDVGRTWVRAATASELRFVESDHINWSNNLYVTVLMYSDIIPMFPRIIQNPADEMDVIFYKIWDVAYTNQNSILGSFINMGSDYAGFLDANGECNVYWSASGTSHLLSSALTYSWSFEGATVTGSTANTPGLITYNTPGHYRTILTATGANGSSDRSIRCVSIYDRPESGTNVPIMNFEFSEFSGSRDSVGYSARVRIREAIPETKVKDGALVIVFKEDWYGYTKQSISRNDKGREGILFVGYINGGTIQYNSDDGYVEFEVISPTNLMEITECFSVSVESKASPTTWYELINMTIKRAIYHYYKWHSNLLTYKDFTCNFTDKNIQYFDADRTSLYDACNTLLDGTIKGRLLSDSLGHIWAEQDVSAIDSASSSLGVALEITKDDWIDTPTIDERHHEEVSFIEMGGIAYEPSTNVSSAYLASAPGSAPGYRGKVERKQGLALSDQSQLNTLVGNLYAHSNSKYPNIELRLRGNYANLDIAPQEQIKLTVETNDTPRRISFADKSFAIRTVSWNWDATNQVIISTIGVSEITQGFAGTTITIPAVPPDAGDDGGTFKQPPINVPPVPTPTTTSVPTELLVNIYENGTYKGSTININFVGSILDVVMTTVSGSSMANIIFDACGCSGTFADGGTLYGIFDTTGAICKGAYWTGTSAYYCYGYSSSDLNDNSVYFSVATGTSATLLAEYTGMYDIDFFLTASLSPTTSSRNFDYTITIHLGDKYSQVFSGTFTGTGGTFLSNQQVSAHNIYLQAGESMVWYIEYVVTDNNPPNLGNAQLCFSIDGASIEAVSA
jgi:hypothetical protein